MNGVKRTGSSPRPFQVSSTGETTQPQVQESGEKKVDTPSTGPYLVDRQTQAKAPEELKSPDPLRESSIGPLDRPPRPSRAHSALEPFRSADPKARTNMELKLMYPTLDLDGVRGMIMADFEVSSSKARSQVRTAYANAGETAPKDLTEVNPWELPDSVVREYVKLSPPDCGSMAKRLVGTFLGQPVGEESPTHTTTINQFNKGALKAGERIEHPDGTISGVGAEDLKRLMKEHPGPLLIHASIQSEGYGHAYVLEKRPQTSPDSPMLGFLHQSYFATHTLSEWTSSTPPQPIDLESRHLDKLPAFLDAKTGGDQLQGNAALFLRPEDRMLKESELREAVVPSQIVFTAIPYDPEKAAQNFKAAL